MFPPNLLAIPPSPPLNRLMPLIRPITLDVAFWRRATTSSSVVDVEPDFEMLSVRVPEADVSPLASFVSLQNGNKWKEKKEEEYHQIRSAFVNNSSREGFSKKCQASSYSISSISREVSNTDAAASSKWILLITVWYDFELSFSSSYPWRAKSEYIFYISTKNLIIN